MFFFALTKDGAPSFWERASIWYQSSLLGELLAYIWDTYFTVHFGAYDNFVLSDASGDNARLIIFAICLGIVAAVLIALYTRNGLGKFVRTLLARDCTSKEAAKTLSELGFFRDPTVRGELVRGFNLRRVVRCVEQEEHFARLAEARKAYEEAKAAGSGEDLAPPTEEPFRIDFLTAHFYIPEELRYRADHRYQKQKSPVLLILGTVAFAILLAALLCYFLPDLLQLADNIINLTAPAE